MVGPPPHDPPHIALFRTSDNRLLLVYRPSADLVVRLAWKALQGFSPALARQRARSARRQGAK